jgi:hypothetical protein
MSCWCSLKWCVYHKRFVDSVCWGGRRWMFSRGSCYFMLTPDRNYPHKRANYNFGGCGWYCMIRKGGVNV